MDAVVLLIAGFGSLVTFAALAFAFGEDSRDLDPGVRL